MNEKELSHYIGRKIKDYRKKKGFTQKELGEKIGVKNNTVSEYESGKISPGQDMLFSISRVLDIKVDDLFPPIDADFSVLEELGRISDTEFNQEDMQFLRSLVEKTLSLNKEDRAKFLESIKFTVEYYERIQNKN